MNSVFVDVRNVTSDDLEARSESCVYNRIPCTRAALRHYFSISSSMEQGVDLGRSSSAVPQPASPGGARDADAATCRDFFARRGHPSARKGAARYTQHVDCATHGQGEQTQQGFSQQAAPPPGLPSDLENILHAAHRAGAAHADIFPDGTVRCHFLVIQHTRWKQQRQSQQQQQQQRRQRV